MKTYDIYLSDEGNSNNKGFSLSLEAAIDKVFDMLQTKDSYINDYKGGTISVVCNETEDVVWAKEIN